MKAVVVTKFGGPEVMRLVDLPKPSAGPGEVIVKLAFVGINFKDKAGAAGHQRAIRVSRLGTVAKSPLLQMAQLP